VLGTATVLTKFIIDFVVQVILLDLTNKIFPAVMGTRKFIRCSESWSLHPTLIWFQPSTYRYQRSII